MDTASFYHPVDELCVLTGTFTELRSVLDTAQGCLQTEQRNAATCMTESHSGKAALVLQAARRGDGLAELAGTWLYWELLAAS